MFQIEVIEVPDAYQAAESHMPCYKTLGGGAFARVYPSGPDEVIKISTGDPDWGYLTYLEEIQKMPSGNTWVPDIRDVKVYMDRSGELSIVTRMERLEPVLGTYGRPRRRRGVDIMKDDMQVIRYALWYDAPVPPSMNTGEARAAQEAVQAIRRAAKSSGHGIDLHDGNFMCRADGTVVITDPLGFPDCGDVWSDGEKW